MEEEKEFITLFQDVTQRPRLKKLAIAVSVALSLLVISIFLAVSGTQRQLETNSNSWIPVFLPLIVTFIGMYIVSGFCYCYLFEVSLLKKQATGFAIAVMIIVTAIPLVLFTNRLECDSADATCIEERGSRLHGWILFLGSTLVISGSYKFFQTCTIIEDQGQYRYFLVYRYVVMRRVQTPIIGLIASLKRLMLGAAILLTNNDINEDLNGTMNEEWVSVLTPVFVTHFIGTIVTYISIIAYCTPSALEKSLSWTQTFQRVLWNSAIIFMKCNIRLFQLLYLLHLARYQDGHISDPSTFSVWGYLVGVTMCFPTLFIFHYIWNPDFLTTCSIIARESEKECGFVPKTDGSHHMDSLAYQTESAVRQRNGQIDVVGDI